MLQMWSGILLTGKVGQPRTYQMFLQRKRKGEEGKGDRMSVIQTTHFFGNALPCLRLLPPPLRRCTSLHTAEAVTVEWLRKGDSKHSSNLIGLVAVVSNRPNGTVITAEILLSFSITTSQSEQDRI